MSRPPRAAVWLLRTLLADAVQESYVGDLLELHDERVGRVGRARAARALWRDAAVALARLPWRRAAAPHHAGDPVLTTLAVELRHAARRLRAAPSFALLCAATLALGIGATTAVFSVAYTALLRPLPYPDADRLVDVRTTTVYGQRSTASPPDFDDWRRAARTLDLAAWTDPSGALTGAGPAEQVATGAVTGAFFRVVGVRPVVGRAFADADAAPGAPNVVVLGHGLWVRRFGGDPRVVGRAVRLDGETREVLGVMPPGFDFPSRAQLWTPLAFSDSTLATQRGAHYLRVVGRLRRGASLASARAELGGLAARQAAAYPSTNAGAGVAVRSLRDATVGGARPALLVLLGAVGLLLLLAAANVANLMLVRAARRERERVVRAALGAGRGRLAAAVLSEAVLLAFAGGAAGVALAWSGTRALDATLRAARPALAESRVDGPVLAFALAVCLVTALGFGLLPAVGAARLRDLATALRAAAAGGGRVRRGAGWRSGWRLRGSLVGGQIAITVLLLTGAALLGESFRRLRRVDLGFVPRGVWTASLALPELRYPPAAAGRYFESLVERARAIPGVRAAGATLALPLSGTSFRITLHEVDGRVLPDAPDVPTTQVRVVTDGYFRAVGMRVVRGRGIEPTDRAESPAVVVVNEALARLLWPGRDPLGRHFTIGTRLDLGRERVHGTVVGVVADVRADAVQREARPEAYWAHRQYPVGGMQLALRADEPSAVARPLAALVAALDPDVPLYEERPLDALVSDAVAEPRLYSLLFAAFAGTALVLAAVGVYGVVSVAVGQRAREFGLRMALGAHAADVTRLVLRQALTPVAAGLAVGLAGALASSRVLAGLLYGVSATDARAFLAVAGVLAAAAGAAVYVPTRRATAVPPTVALRAE